MTGIIIDLVAIFLIIGIVGTAARFDKRERSISTSTLGIMSGITVIFLCTKFIIFELTLTISDSLIIFITVLVLSIMLFGKMFIARGDIIIILITSIILPSIYGIPTIGITFCITLIISTMFHITKTFIPNLKELLLTRHVFIDIDDSILRKIIAFFIVHKRTPYEHFCFSAEKISYGHRHLVLLPKNLDNIDIKARTKYVITAIPLMIPYFISICIITTILILNII